MLKSADLEPIYPSYPFTRFQKQPPRGVLEKGVLKLYSTLAGEHTCRSVISIKLLKQLY